MKWGYYSPTAAEQYGTRLWETEDGEVVHITTVCHDVDGAGYDYPDKVSLGLVTKWVGDGRQPTLPNFINQKERIYSADRRYRLSVDI